MTKAGPEQKRVSVITALVVTGFGIGWLAGLSVSPVVSIVIASVTGSVATIIAALSGVKEELLDAESSSATLRRLLRAVTPVPIAWLMVGLIVGSLVGIKARNYNWFGPPPSMILAQEVDKWAAYGLDQQFIARQLFEVQYGVNATVDNTPGETRSDVIGFTALKSAEAQQQARELCKVVRENPGIVVRTYITDVITIQQVISLTKTITDDQVLKEALAILCTDG